MSVTDDLSDGFFRKVKQLAVNLGCDPLDLLKVWFSESIGIFADQKNQFGAPAYGINQMSQESFKGADWTGTGDEYLQLTAEQQLPFVEKFYTPYKGRLPSPERIYQLNFLSATFNSVTDPDTPICEKNGKYAWAYRAQDNPQHTANYFDTANKGYINLTDLRRALEGSINNPRVPARGGAPLSTRWKEIVQRLGGVSDATAAPAGLLSGWWAVSNPEGSFRYRFDFDGDVQWAYSYNRNVIADATGEWTQENGSLKITWKHSTELWNLPLNPAGQSGTYQGNDGTQGTVSARRE